MRLPFYLQWLEISATPSEKIVNSGKFLAMNFLKFASHPLFFFYIFSITLIRSSHFTFQNPFSLCYLSIMNSFLSRLLFNPFRELLYFTNNGQFPASYLMILSAQV